MAQTLVQTVAWPFLKLGSFALARWDTSLQFLTDQSLLRAQNNALKDQMAEFSAHQIALSELRSENARLKGLLDFRVAHVRDAIAGRVIGYDPSGWTQSFLIDKGQADAIVVNQAVICPQGVVGKIAETSPYTSKVLLLVDSRIRIGAMLENARDVGIVEGRPPGHCRILYLPKETAVELGQRVLTSGLGGIFPKGLVIGKVISAGLDELGLYQIAEIEPAVRMGRLEEVLVLKNAFLSVEKK